MFDLILDVLELVAHLFIRIKNIFEEEEGRSVPRLIFNLTLVLGLIALIYYGLYRWLT